MNKDKDKKVKSDKPNDPKIHKEIKKMLKEEKTKKDIAAHFGFNSKVSQYIIDRYELEENLIIPKLVGK